MNKFKYFNKNNDDWLKIIWNSFFPTGNFDVGDLCPISGARNANKICAPFTHNRLDLALANGDLLLNSFFEKIVDIADGICTENFSTDRATIIPA